MDLTPTFFAFAIPAVILAGISKGGAGSGAGFAATPLLALILEPAQAVALMLPLLIVMDATAIRAWWGRWNWPTARVLILGGAIGTALGAVIFTWADPRLLKVMIGLIALAFVAFKLAQGWGMVRSPERLASDRAGVFWGAMGGITSFISHAGGPPLTIFLLGRRLDKTGFQATMVAVIAVINLMKAVAYTGMGLFEVRQFIAVALLVPVALVGVFLGVWGHRYVPERVFFGLIYVFLTVTGCKLVWDGLA